MQAVPVRILQPLSVQKEEDLALLYPHLYSDLKCSLDLVQLERAYRLRTSQQSFGTLDTLVTRQDILAS